MLGLIISDVMGDRLDLIASGPTAVSDDAADALAILREFDKTLRRVPETVVDLLKSERQHEPSNLGPDRVHNFVIGNNQDALDAAREKAESLGYRCRAESLFGGEQDANSNGKKLAALARNTSQQIDAGCCIFGGEPTVKLCDHPGQGGRNQHLVLSALCELLPSSETGPIKDFCILSGGTDGQDGNTPVAGAWINEPVLRFVAKNLQRLDPWQSLLSNDSYSFFCELGCFVQPGVTKTNVCDLQVVVSLPGA
jgi:glycerate-2-kinase